MPPISNAEKLRRADELAWGGAFGTPTANFAHLTIQWARPFDCYCYVATDIPLGDDRYQKWFGLLKSASGWSDEEIISHGRKIRMILQTVYDNIDTPPKGAIVFVMPPLKLAISQQSP